MVSDFCETGSGGWLEVLRRALGLDALFFWNCGRIRRWIGFGQIFSIAPRTAGRSALRAGAGDEHFDECFSFFRAGHGSACRTDDRVLGDWNHFIDVGNRSDGFRWTQSNGDLFRNCGWVCVFGNGPGIFLPWLHNGTELAMVADFSDPIRAGRRRNCDKNMARIARSYEEIHRRGRKEECPNSCFRRVCCSHGQKSLTVIQRAELLRARGAFASNRARRRIRQFFGWRRARDGME